MGDLKIISYLESRLDGMDSKTIDKIIKLCNKEKNKKILNEKTCIYRDTLLKEFPTLKKLTRTLNITKYECKQFDYHISTSVNIEYESFNVHYSFYGETDGSGCREILVKCQGSKIKLLESDDYDELDECDPKNIKKLYEMLDYNIELDDFKKYFNYISAHAYHM